jgi:hypothetical protein
VYLALPVLSGDAQLGGWIRRFQAQRPGRAVLVVVLDVDAKDLLQVVASHDQQPVQALGADRANPALRSSSAIRRLRACWVTQAPSGLAVTPARWTHRVSSSMKNSTSSRRSQTVSTVKESGRGESHPPALAEPCVNLSAHTAPITQPYGHAPSRQCTNRVGSRLAMSARNRLARLR